MHSTRPTLNITNIFRWHTDLYIDQLNRNTSCDCRKLLINLSITQLFRTITLSKFNCEQAHHLGLHETRFSTTSSKRGSKEMNEHPPLPTCTILKCFENISFFLLFTDKWTWLYRLSIQNFVLLANTKYLYHFEMISDYMPRIIGQIAVKFHEGVATT